MSQVAKAIAYLKKASRRKKIVWWELSMSDTSGGLWCVELQGPDIGGSRSQYRYVKRRDPFCAAIEAFETL